MAKIGYIRVSTLEQNTTRQLDTLRSKLDKIFTDKASGKNTQRSQLMAMMDYVREGDTVHVHSLDRLGRNTLELQQLIKQLTDKGVRVSTEKEGFTFDGNDGPVPCLMLSILSAFAEFERRLIKERQAEGIAKAKARGQHLGRRKALTPEKVTQLREQLNSGATKASAAEHFGIGLTTLYNYLKTD